MTLHPDADAAAGTMFGTVLFSVLAVVVGHLWVPAVVIGIPYALVGFIFASIDYAVLAGWLE
jgi:hypothetical protein